MVKRNRDEVLESVSELMFGRAMRLPILEYVRNASEDFFAAEIADHFGYPASNVSKELERQLKLGMIRLIVAKRGDRAKRFERVDGPLWGVVDAASAAREEVSQGLDQLLDEPGPGG